MTHYWTYKRDGEVFDAQFDTRDEAQKYADEIFAEEVGEASECAAEEEIELIGFELDQDGEMIVKERHQSWVCFTYYHGDYAEHSVWHAGGGGVL